VVASETLVIRSIQCDRSNFGDIRIAVNLGDRDRAIVADQLKWIGGVEQVPVAAIVALEMFDLLAIG